MVISVVQLGRVDYSTAQRLQQRLVELRKNNQIENVLLLLEHTPVITLGRNASRKNVLAGDEFLKQHGVELFECDRGGDVTYHGPGQLVGYPIFDLRSFLGPDGRRKTLGAVDYVRRLEEVLIRTCADYGIPTERVKGMTGVWTQAAVDASRSPSATKQQAKIAAIGVHISRGVTSHGFALNVADRALENFELIVPCGITGKPVTSIERELCGLDLRLREHGPEAAKPSMDEVAQVVGRNFGRVFNSQIVWVDSLDALLGRKVGVPVRPPEELRKLTGEEEKFWA